MCAPDEVVLRVGERVLEQLLREKVSGLGVTLRGEPPLLELTLLGTRIRLRLEEWDEKGRLTFVPQGAAGVLARLLGRVLPDTDRIAFERGRIVVTPLPMGLPLRLQVTRVELCSGSIRVVLKRDITV